MEQYTLEEFNKRVSTLTLDEISRLTDDEILGMAMERPGHPEQYGFMLRLQYFQSQEHFANALHALMTRLQKVDNLKEKMADRKEGGQTVARFSGEEFLKIVEVAKSFLEKGTAEEPPNFVIYVGMIGSGKTTSRRHDYASGYVHFELGEIYNAVKKEFGGDNPKLSSYAAVAGDMILQESLKNKKNIVIEIIGENKDLIEPLINKINEMGYKLSLNYIHCEPVEAYERHLRAVKDDPDYISADITQEATLSFFFQQLGLGEMPIAKHK